MQVDWQGEPLCEPFITEKARCCSARMSAVPTSIFMPMAGFWYVVDWQGVFRQASTMSKA